MEIISTALELLKRQSALEEGLRLPGGIRITEERELHTVRERLARFPYPNAIEAVIEAARNLGRPIDGMTVTDVERWSARGNGVAVVERAAFITMVSVGAPND